MAGSGSHAARLAGGGVIAASCFGRGLRSTVLLNTFRLQQDSLLTALAHCALAYILGLQLVLGDGRLMAQI